MTDQVDEIRRNAKRFSMVRDFGAVAMVDPSTWPAAREEAWIPIRRVRPGLSCDFCWKPIPSGSPGNTSGSRGTKAWLSKDRGVYEHIHCRSIGFKAEQAWREHVDARDAAVRAVRFGTREIQPLEGRDQVAPRELVIDPFPELLEIDVLEYAGELARNGWAEPVGITAERRVVRGDRQVIAAVFLGLQLVPVEVLAGEASAEEAA